MKKAFLTILVAVIAMSALFPSYLTPYDPIAVNLDCVKSPPVVKHPFGTDAKGRDILSRILYGARLSLGVSLLASLMSFAIGLTLGLVAGFFSKWVDTVIMALVDLTLSFPSLLLAIGISVLLPPGSFTVMIAIALVGWASLARLIRGEVLKIKQTLYVEAARSIGAGAYRIIVYHILPQCLLIAQAMAGIKFGGYILTEASLSFLGLGPQPPQPSWGSMISENRTYILSEPWMVLFPGLAIAVTVLAFNMIGDVYRKTYGIKG